MCKYVVIKKDDNGDPIVHTECGYLVANHYVLTRLMFSGCRCEFCGDIIEYAES